MSTHGVVWYLDASPEFKHSSACLDVCTPWEVLRYFYHLVSTIFISLTPGYLWFLLFTFLHPPSQSHPATTFVNSTRKSGSSSATSRRAHLPPCSLHPPVLLPLVQRIVQVHMPPFLLYSLQAYNHQCGLLGPNLVHQAILHTLSQSRYRMVVAIIGSRYFILSLLCNWMQNCFIHWFYAGLPCWSYWQDKLRKSAVEPANAAPPGSSNKVVTYGVILMKCLGKYHPQEEQLSWTLARFPSHWIMS